jgi:hypothetical protein
MLNFKKNQEKYKLSDLKIVNSYKELLAFTGLAYRLILIVQTN